MRRRIAHQYHSRIIFSSPPIGLSYQLPASLFPCRQSGKKNMQDVVVAQHFCQAIRAEKEDIVHIDRECDDIRIKNGLYADGSGQDMTFGMNGRLGLCQPSAFNLFFNKRMIAGEPFKRALVQAIDAAIADMSNGGPRRGGAVDMHCSERGPHSQQLTLSSTFLKDDVIGLAESTAEKARH